MAGARAMFSTTTRKILPELRFLKSWQVIEAPTKGALSKKPL